MPNLTEKQKECIAEKTRDFYSYYVPTAIQIGTNSFARNYSFLSSAAKFDQQIQSLFEELIREDIGLRLDEEQRDDIIRAFKRCFSSKSPLRIWDRDGRRSPPEKQAEFKEEQIALFMTSFIEELDQIGLSLKLDFSL